MPNDIILNEEVLNEASEITSTDSPTVIYLVTDSSDKRTDVEEDETLQVINTPVENVLQSVSISNEKITADDATGFKATLLSIIGDYETVVTDYTYNNGSYTSHSIDVTPDYVWISSALFILVGIVCMFRFISTMINRL